MHIRKAYYNIFVCSGFPVVISLVTSESIIKAPRDANDN